MPNIRQGLGEAILELNGMARCGLPDVVLRAIKRAIDGDEWIIVGVASRKPVDCTAKRVSFALPASELHMVTSDAAGADEAAPPEPVQTTGEPPKQKSRAATQADEKRGDSGAPSENPEPSPAPAGKAAPAVAKGEEDGTCCQLIRSDASPYVRPATKEIDFSVGASVPGLAEIKIEARGRRTAAPLEPDHTSNCPGRCQDDRMRVPVSVDFDVRLRLRGWIGLEGEALALSPGSELRTGKLDFGPQIGEQGRIRFEQQGSGSSGIKIDFDFEVRVRDGIVLNFAFECDSGTYEGVPSLQHSDGSGAAAGTATAPEPPAGAVFPVQCRAICYLAGAITRNPLPHTVWTFEFTLMQTATVQLFATTDANGNFLFGTTQPVEAVQLPYFLYEGRISEKCEATNFAYSIRVTRRSHTSVAIGSTSGSERMACGDETDTKYADASFGVGSTPLTIRLAIFSECMNRPG
ncbi:MAG TPA: hypothetical protein VIN77_09545 [Aurantimonas sp.]